MSMFIDAADYEDAARKWVAENNRLRAALQFAIDGYPRSDISHEHFRVEVYRAALDALNPPEGA